MRQRVVGAIGLSCSPEVLIADEPTTSLDVTVQAAYLALLKDIQRQTELAILFITHDFGVVARMCDRVAVMYAGRIVETASTWELFDRPAHPYAEALLNSVPDVRLGTKRLYAIEGYPPSIYDKSPGCPFAPRCPYGDAAVHSTDYPPEVEVGARAHGPVAGGTYERGRPMVRHCCSVAGGTQVLPARAAPFRGRVPRVMSGPSMASPSIFNRMKR